MERKFPDFEYFVNLNSQKGQLNADTSDGEKNKNHRWKSQSS